MITVDVIAEVERIRVALKADAISMTPRGLTVQLASDPALIALCAEHRVTARAVHNDERVWLTADIVVDGHAVWLHGPHHLRWVDEQMEAGHA